ncbi:protein FAR1-RELATED SEQUENCE 5-like [Henckelia pumila]|uniref:protein FAR1-RELATED SEQUENCE 5-like n=1 Tax=Henckelia pumila TaxID=405737 RepID=UPI003C6E5B52
MEGNSGDDQLYIPQVVDDRKPKIGMEFASLEEAFSFYNQYAQESGFSARISNSKKNKTNEVVWKKNVCFKEGHTDETRSNKQVKCDQPKKERARGEFRTGCKSKISVVKNQTGNNWVVSTFMESHNHPLSTPSKFIEAMSKDKPNIIITDQDPAMTKAIAQVFPQTVHRYCLWHILNKFTDKLDPINFRDHYRSIKNVIANSIAPDEFENSWKEVIKYANLEKNDWLSLMYELRHKWVPAYFNHIFSAGMSSSLRSESSHAFFKRALRHQRHNELVANHIDMNEHPKTKTIWPMETQMVKVYTKKKWMEFQNEMNESHGYHLQKTSIGVELVVYDTYVSFFRINQVSQFPEKYILKRWTRDAKVGAICYMPEQNVIEDPERCLISRHSKLSYRASVLIDNASLTNEGTRFLDEQFDYIDSKIREINSSRTFNSGIQMKKTRDETLGIIDPSEVRTKGCGKRLKSSKEKSTSKTRLCHGCGRRGVSHDKRNCPNLCDGSIVDNHHNNDDNTDEEDFESIAGSNNMKTTGVCFND